MGKPVSIPLEKFIVLLKEKVSTNSGKVKFVAEYSDKNGIPDGTGPDMEVYLYENIVDTYKIHAGHVILCCAASVYLRSGGKGAVLVQGPSILGEKEIGPAPKEEDIYVTDFIPDYINDETKPAWKVPPES